MTSGAHGPYLNGPFDVGQQMVGCDCPITKQITTPVRTSTNLD